MYVPAQDGRTHGRARRGFTLIEIVLVLAVGLGLIVGGVIFYRQAAFNALLHHDARRVIAIATEVRGNYLSKPDFVGLNTIDATAASGLPPETWTGVDVSRANVVGRQAFFVTGQFSDGRICPRLKGIDLGPRIHAGSTCLTTSGMHIFTITFLK